MDSSGQYKVLATFLHEYQFGRVLGGIERRFIEVTKLLSTFGITVMALEYPPSVGASLRSSYKSVLVARYKAKTVQEEVLLLVRLSLLSTFYGRSLKCELVYSPSPGYSQVIPAFVASFVLRKPLVIIFHSPPPNPILGGPASILKWRRAQGETLRKALIMTLIHTLQGLSIRRASAFIAVSKSTAAEVGKSIFAQNLFVSGNGIDEGWFHLEHVQKQYDACFLGRISPRKNVDLLIRAWELVVNERPGAKLILIGGGEDSKYVRKCQDLISSLRLEENVKMSGFLSDESVRLALDSSKVFVLPTRREGFGLVVLEAMARGIPCIITNLPSLRENFGDSALFVNEPTPESWAREICRLLDDEAMLNQLSESGKRQARKFTWEEVAQREAVVIRSLIRSRHG